MLCRRDFRLPTLFSPVLTDNPAAPSPWKAPRGWPAPPAAFPPPAKIPPPSAAGRACPSAPHRSHKSDKTQCAGSCPSAETLPARGGFAAGPAPATRLLFPLLGNLGAA